MSVFFEQRQVVAGLLDADRAIAMEAMATRLIAGDDLHDGAVNDLGAVQQHDPVHRPNEFRFAGAPTHTPWNRQGSERLLDESGHEFTGRLAGLDDLAGQPFTLLGGCAPQGVRLDAALFRKCCARRSQVAVLVEGDRHRRSFLLGFAVFLAVRERCDQDRQPARTRVRVDVAVIEARIVDGRHQVFGERGHQVAKRFRGQLFGTDFYEEIVGLAHEPASPPTDSTIGNPRASREA